MATAKKAPVTDGALVIKKIEREGVDVPIIGTTPLIMNSMSEKARQQLLYPSTRKTTAQRASSLKHDPHEEFNGAAYVIPDPEANTLLGIPSQAFKAAMMTAALRLSGLQKTQIAQLLFVEGDITEVYGTPELFMRMVRTADMKRTPDIRTRPIVASWAAIVRVSYVVPTINQTSVVNLLHGAGQVAGVGDWRIEKGGRHGAFRVASPDDEQFLQIVAEGGRLAQAEAMREQHPYDDESEELLSWFDDERARRGHLAVVA